MKRLAAAALLGVLLICFGVLLYFTIDSPLTRFEKESLNPGIRSAASPSDLLIPYSHLPIDVQGRILDAFLVLAPPTCPNKAAVLLFHGRNETIGDWVKVQKRLYDGCVSSVAFDYTGHGRSTPGGTVEHLNEDASAAWEAFVKLFPPAIPRCVLGHSLGNAPMLAMLGHAEIPPDCVVMASPFASLREMAVAGGLPRVLDFAVPDVWDNVAAVGKVEEPLLWVHSRGDETVPIAQGQAVYDAKPGKKTTLTVDGLDHNAIYETVPDEIWRPVLAFVHGAKGE
jgi:pimeloyl-ACP methyl ester carboxylesterase